MPAAQRLHALDAARGVLAVVVVVHHVALFLGSDVLGMAGDAAVMCFFAMSGYVLARAHDGRYLAFLLRRQIRLWPVFAICLTAAYATHGTLAPAGDLLWWPMTLDPVRMVDPPAWSLYAEVWATPLLPVMFWTARRGQAAALAMMVAGMALMLAVPATFPLLFMAAGVACTTLPIGWPQRVPAPLLWLGKVSYSLYLSHSVVLHAVGPALGVVLVLPVAWLVWWTVERPSIAWSRRVWAAKRQPHASTQGISKSACSV